MSSKLRFSDLPVFSHVIAGLVLFHSWVLLAEFVIDRYGLSRFLPFYRMADVCVWELAVAAGIVAGLALASRRSA